MIKRILAIVVGILFLMTTATTTAQAIEGPPPKHKLYNQKGSAATIIGWSGAGCTGSRVGINKGVSSSTQGRSYKVGNKSRYKIGKSGSYRQVNSNVCVTAPASSTYMSVFVYNYKG